MKLTALLNNRISEIDSRKKLVKLKNADEAYKKNATYFSPVSNPAMEELVNLLMGKKEKEENNDLEQSIQKIKSGQTVEVLNSTEASKSAMMMNKTITPVEMMLNKEISVKLLPETSMPEPQPVQLKSAGQMAKERLTEKAIATYKFQMSMARNGFEVLQPMIYRTA